MTDRVVVLRGTYHDSVKLMLASRGAEETDGVGFAAALAATPVNLELLAGHGFDLAGKGLGPNDLVVAIKAEDEAAADSAVAEVERRLIETPDAGTGDAAPKRSRSLRSAARGDPGLNLAFVSVPGRHAAFEAAAGIEAGLHVFCFSAGPTLAEEALLKQRARERGLLLMGPDCGTAIVDGIAFGFANAIERGPVGVVGASRTGIQQLTCLLDAAGLGISHAIGVGGRDLSEEVGGVMTISALELLAADPGTESIVAISKPPDPKVAERVAIAAASTGKPTVLGLLGAIGAAALQTGVEVTTSIESAAARSAELRGGSVELHDVPLPEAVTPGAIRGLFCGGTLCAETSMVVTERAGTGAGHGFIDFGDDAMTEGRAHPMIDPSLRNQHFEREANDPEVGVIVMDVVLGYGAHPDPSEDLAPLINESLHERPNDLTVIVSLCGTAGDPQGIDGQATELRDAGALVTRNAAHAGRLALAAGGFA